MTVKIFPPGPKYYENFDKIAWDRDKQKSESGQPLFPCPSKYRKSWRRKWLGGGKK